MRAIRRRLRYYSDSAVFVAQKYVCGYAIQPEPCFDKEGLSFFKTIIRKSSTYLEFGCGGSTLIASQFVNTLVSVESDKTFMAAVQVELSKSSRQCESYLLAPNIGITREWGYPIFERPTRARLSRWREYPGAPWPLFKAKALEPDTILIDGRFRVACALESLLNIGPSTRIVVDDYVGRSYRTIEQFADLIALHGRMAEFRKKSDFDAKICGRALTAAYSDVR